MIRWGSPNPHALNIDVSCTKDAKPNEKVTWSKAVVLVPVSGGAPALVMLCHEGYDLYLPTWNLHHTLTLLMLFVLQHCT